MSDQTLALSVAFTIIVAAMALGVWIATKFVVPSLRKPPSKRSAGGRVLLGLIVAAAVAVGVWLGGPDKIDFMTLAVGFPLGIIAIFFATRTSKGT